jgi:predicted transposase YdaD
MLPQLTREEIQAMFHLGEQQLKQSRFYQQILAEGEAIGEVRGKNKGRAEGETILLQRQLTRKLGPLPKDAPQRLAKADAEALLVWGERVLDARSLDEVWGD